MIASRCFPHPILSLTSEQTLKDLKDPRGTSVEVRRMAWLTGSSGLHRNSPQRLNVSSIRVSDQIRVPEIPITLHPHARTHTNTHKLNRKQTHTHRLAHLIILLPIVCQMLLVYTKQLQINLRHIFNDFFCKLNNFQGIESTLVF